MRDGYQFDHNRLHLSFGGFEDIYGIDHYLFSLRRANMTLRNLNLGKKREVLLSDLNLAEDTYTVGVHAVNNAGYKSMEYTKEFIVLKELPVATGKIVFASRYI